MNEEKQRAIASMGGRAAHAQGRAHEFTQDEARAAGRKGGQAVRDKYGPDFYAEIGRAGGGARRKRRQRATDSQLAAQAAPMTQPPAARTVAREIDPALLQRQAEMEIARD
jgi:general stress protein YciG